MDHFDLIVIGTGTGSPALAQRAASLGKPILLIERGNSVVRCAIHEATAPPPGAKPASPPRRKNIGERS